MTALTTTTAEQLEYHGLYVIAILAMLAIVVTLGIAALLEAHRNRDSQRDD